MRFEIGQECWVADFQALAPAYVTCPDCGGTGRLRVTFHDETQVSIECRNCSSGYDPPSGQIIVYRQQAGAKLTTITGVEINGDMTRWHVNGTAHGYQIVDDDKAFDNREAALAYAEGRAAEWEQEQRDKIATKEKDTRTWAWNASYHRKCIKQAQKNIEYHSAKLAVAAIKAKDKTAQSEA